MTDANNRTVLWQYDNPYVAWLACLSACMCRVRVEGLMSIESDVDCPEQSDLFRAFPETAQEPYRTFATDLLRMMVGGKFDPNDLGVYAEAAMGSLLAANPLFGSKTDKALLRTIWLTLWAMAKGNAPQIAIEYGRQAVPVRFKPDAETLRRIAKKSDSVWRRDTGRGDSLNERIDSFIASISA